MGLKAYCEKFARLNVATRHGRHSPHKICMLLAVLEMARSGALRQNRIAYAPALLERYNEFFGAVRTERDHPSPWYPFFHLKGSLRGGAPSFWHLEPLPGRTEALAAMTAVNGPGDITRNISHAYLDEDLFQLMQRPEAIATLSRVLSEHWFDRGLEDLQGIAKRASRISRYESRLRNGITGLSHRGPPPPSYVRRPAFRRVVIQTYDFRCSATGLRVILPSGEALVEAAHIHPFSEAGDDDPRNGLALTPDMHWAMDRNLIAPGPDHRWHVSPVLDDRISDYRQFNRLEGKPLFLPREPLFYPKQQALEWRMERLRNPEWRPTLFGD